MRDIIGATITKIIGAEEGSDCVEIITDRGTLAFYHMQECCESVSVEDVAGDPADMIGGVIALFDERSDDDPDGWEPSEYVESYTWTFYEIRTSRGDMTLRWRGESNGYYSERVDYAWTPRSQP